MLRRLLIASTIVAVAVPAFAQETMRVRGTIEKVDGNTITAKLRDGSAATIKLADNPRITALTRAQLSDIKEGSFIGVTAMPQPDGSQKALEVHIFPEQMRGTGEGHRPFTTPGSTKGITRAYSA